MNINIIKEENELKIHPIEPFIKGLIDKRKHLFLSFVNISCFDSDQKVYIYYDPDNQFSFFIQSDIKEAFIYFVKIFFNEKIVDISFSYKILLIAESLKFSEKDFFDLFYLLHWQTGKKGIDFFYRMKNFSANLKEKVLDKKLSINEAYFFDANFINYDNFLELLPKNLSFSETNQIISNITEYSKKENKNIEEIIRLLDFTNPKTLVLSAFSLKYSIYSKIKLKFNNFIQKFNLPSNCKIIYDENFETQNYKLEIGFKDKKNLYEKISVIKKSLESNVESEDLFIHKNLFNEENNV
ncbi:MAG: hypothetical protein A2086_07470 [Spirochaetes bacterium GWD1_27_9]|nr:MAG: hypothetical protein A2Z98_18115 [Spirochaetes bacterium GWB1_27_13]OHD27946.1 MAG: hypothetical protein A2Y34_13305 [Spirochaetes bacterium GWC1_27_15]OHD44772.1 MAG: hypothetical protein A2086_07470 [Spirochaetes bacterium GWD1_27_9]